MEETAVTGMREDGTNNVGRVYEAWVLERELKKEKSDPSHPSTVVFIAETSNLGRSRYYADMVKIFLLYRVEKINATSDDKSLH